VLLSFFFFYIACWSSALSIQLVFLGLFFHIHSFICPVTLVSFKPMLSCPDFSLNARPTYFMDISTGLSFRHLSPSLNYVPFQNLLLLLYFISWLMTLLSPQLPKIRNMEPFIDSCIHLIGFLIGI